MNNVPSTFRGLAISMLAAAALEANRFVKISANNTFATAGANDHAIGITLKESKAAGDLIAVELIRYTKKVEMVCGGDIVAGEYVKLTSDSGGNQRALKFVPGTDAEERKLGVCLIGASSGGTVTILA